MCFPPLMMSLDEIIPRRAWGAELPSKLAPALVLPVLTVVFVYTNTENCSTQEECIRAVQRLQRYHKDRGQYDIPYNFVLGGDHHIYEGRGWNTTATVPWDLEYLPNRAIVVARIGQAANDDFQRSEDFMRGYDVIHFGQLKLIVDVEFELKPVYHDWNRPEVVHGFDCEDPPLASAMQDLFRTTSGYYKYIQSGVRKILK